MTPAHAGEPIKQRTVALFAMLVALVAAGAAEYAIRKSSVPALGISLYGIASLLIAVTATRFRLLPAAPVQDTPAQDTPAQDTPAQDTSTLDVTPDATAQDASSERALRPAGWLLLAAGAGGSLALAWFTHRLLRVDTGDPAGSTWWLLSLLPLAAASMVCWRMETPHVLWQSEGTRTDRGRIWLTAAVAAILVVAALARFLWLDRVPFGINPDEGDRAALAIQSVRGTTPIATFEAGWYYISMLYFEAMAWAFRWIGMGYVQARAFTAAFGLASVAITIWIGLRHFSWRVGVLAGLLAATAGVVLQFSRLTTEAGPTATLWLLSLALILEGARGGRALQWTLAGFAGGLSLYFYPTGRVWALLASAWGVYLLTRWLLARRSETLALARGLAAAAVAALVIATPYLTWIAAQPHELTLRYEQTTIFRAENAARLVYYRPELGMTHLLGEQLLRTLGIFNYYPDGGGVWPIRQPILSPALALLVLLGVAIASTRWRDVRATLLGIAFWVGIAGVVITVETPNLIRMATAIPVLPLLAALTLEESIRRTRGYFNSELSRRRAAALATGLAVLLAVGIGLVELRYYFNEYARMNLWAGANQEGRALSLLPEGTRYVSLGSSFHMINSGWVRLLALDADRAGFRHPGSNLPFLGDGQHDIGVLIYPRQEAYLPWLQTLYPAARVVDYRLPDEPLYFTLLHIPVEALADQGMVQTVADGRDAGPPVTVAGFGDAPAQQAQGAPSLWTGTWRVPQQWNYWFRLSGATATLSLDGMPLLANSPDSATQTFAINLARGDHTLALAGAAGEVTLEVARQQPGAEPFFAPIPAAELLAARAGAPHGLAAVVQIEGQNEQRRQDNTLATCCLANLLRTGNRPADVEWQGRLNVPVAGEYGFRLQTPAPASLMLGESEVVRVEEAGAQEIRLALPAGETPIAISVALPQGANGALELLWQPPGAPWSIVPHTSLTPDATLLWQAPLPEEQLLSADNFPTDVEQERLR